MNFALPNQIAEGTYAVFNGDLFVPTVQVVQIDHIGFQTAQTVFAIGAKRLGTPIDHTHFLAIAIHIHTMQTAFAGQREATAVSRQSLADDALAFTKPVQSGGIKKIHALIQRGQQEFLGFGL